MEYEDNLDFATRTYEIYKRTKDLCREYEYTHAAGALLNMLTAIRPDKEFIVDVSGVGKTEDELIVIRDGFSHKIPENYEDIPKAGQIVKLSVSNHEGKNTMELGLDEIDRLIEKLNEAVVKKLKD